MDEVGRPEAADPVAHSLTGGRCLLCGGERHRIVFEEHGLHVLQCRDCGHVFSSHRADPHFDGFWGDAVQDEEHFYWSKARDRLFRDFIRRFLQGRSGRLLDMGCGLGFFLRRVASLGTWEAHGCEISPAAVHYARHTLGLANVLCSRPEDVPIPDESMDVITMWDVLDHIALPDPLIRRCHAVLKNEGVCFIRTPNVRVQLPRARVKRLLVGMRPDRKYLQPRDHLHHYSQGSIRRLLERNGFSAIDFVHLQPVQALVGPVRALRLKSLGFHAVRMLAAATKGRVNLDNLFVVARKQS
jgi:SAM-dependent methyltransferase